MTKTVKAYDVNENVISSAVAINDEEIDMLVDFMFSIPGVYRIEVK